MARSLVVLCSLVALAQAYTTFQPNCTAPSTSVNFVSSSETRGTLDILWSCLFTIVACTWTVQHLNVPEQREDRDKGWRGDIKWALKRTCSSAKWMLATAVAPELLIAKNGSDLEAIKHDFERLSQLAEEDEVPWSRSHSLFANIGGFVIRGNVPGRVGKSQEARTEPASPPNADSRDGSSNDQEQDGILEHETGEPHPQSSSSEKKTSDVETGPMEPSPQYPNPYHLVAPDLLALREAGFLERLPYITIAELNDRNKSDSLVRLIAIVQSLWMIIQIIVRASRHLAISQLEIAVAAFAICAIAIYGLNWEKPKGVQTPYTLLTYHGDIPKAVLEVVRKEREADNSFLGSFISTLMYFLTFDHYSPDRPSGSPVANHFSPVKFDKDTHESVGLLFSGMVFSAIHVAAWDFVFPTLLERKLWWAASLICTAVPLVLLLIAMLGSVNAIMKVPGFESVLGAIIVLSPFPYIIARIFLLVEVFRTLCFLPPSAYVATWAGNVPHLA